MNSIIEAQREELIWCLPKYIEKVRNFFKSNLGSAPINLVENDEYFIMPFPQHSSEIEALVCRWEDYKKHTYFKHENTKNETIDFSPEFWEVAKKVKVNPYGRIDTTYKNLVHLFIQKFNEK